MKKDLIFDVGGVLIDYRWQDMLSIDLGLERERAIEIGEQVFEDPLWKELDLGTISVEKASGAYEEKYPQWRDEIHWFLSHAELMSIPRKAVWKEIERLKKSGHRIYLLSNYSKELLEKHTEGAEFYKYLDGKMVSYMVHQIKPDPAIYKSLFTTYDLDPTNCIFYDDRSENTQVARELGMETVTVESEEQLLEVLRGLE